MYINPVYKEPVKDFYMSQHPYLKGTERARASVVTGSSAATADV